MSKNQWYKESPENYENYLINASLYTKRKTIANIEYRLSPEGISEHKAKLESVLQERREEAIKLLERRESGKRKMAKKRFKLEAERLGYAIKEGDE
jgi:hypothetical protein